MTPNMLPLDFPSEEPILFAISARENIAFGVEAQNFNERFGRLTRRTQNAIAHIAHIAPDV